MNGLFFDEIEQAYVFELGSYLFTAQNIRSYSSRFVPVGFHMKADEAAAGLFGKQAAAGWHTCCGWMVCFVRSNTEARQARALAGMALPEIGPSPGIKNVRWPRPVFADDAITYRNTVTGKRELSSKPSWGMVGILAEGLNAAGEPVMSFEANLMVARR